MSVDEALFRWLNNLAGRSDFSDGLLRLVICDYLIPFLAVLAVAWLWFAGRGECESRRFQRAALTGFTALVICQPAVALINIAVGRPRPFEQFSAVTLLSYEPINSSFPAHPVATVVALGVVLWPVTPRLGGAVTLLGLVLGVGRIIAGLWFPTDVLGGVALGVLCALVGGVVVGRLSRAETLIRRKAADLGLG